MKFREREEVSQKDRNIEVMSGVKVGLARHAKHEGMVWWRARGRPAARPLTSCGTLEHELNPLSISFLGFKGKQGDKPCSAYLQGFCGTHGK